MKSLPKTVTRQRRGCDLNPGPSAPEYSTLTTRLPSSLQLGHIAIHTGTWVNPAKTAEQIELSPGIQTLVGWAQLHLV